MTRRQLGGLTATALALVAAAVCWLGDGSPLSVPLEPRDAPRGAAPLDPPLQLAPSGPSLERVASPAAEPLPLSAVATLTPGTPVLPDPVRIEVSAYMPSAPVKLGEPRPGPVRAAASLELGLSSDRERPGEPVQLVHTTLSGTAVVKLPWSSVAMGPGGEYPEVWVRSEGVGVLTRMAWAAVPRMPGGLAKVSLTVQPGVRLEGRLLGPGGRPVAGRVVALTLDGPAAGKRTPLGWAADDGLFGGELRHSGLHVLLGYGRSADAADRSHSTWQVTDDLGTGATRPFEVDFDEPPPLIELRVSGPGVLRGQVLDMTGAPAAGLRVEAELAELDELDDRDAHWARTEALRQQGGGHLDAHTFTNADGRFEMVGLRAGDYVLRSPESFWALEGLTVAPPPGAPSADATPGPGRSVQADRPLTPRPVPADGAALTLRLSRPHLVVHVRHRDGTPVKGVVPDNPLSFDGRILWSDGVRLLISRASGAPTPAVGEASLPGRGPRLIARRVGAGDFVLERPGSAPLDIGLLGGGLPWRPLRVALPADALRLDVTLVAPEPEALATLRLSALDSGGGRLDEAFRVRVLDPGTGVPLLSRAFDAHALRDGPVLLDVPAGDVVVVVEGRAVYSGHGHRQAVRGQGSWESALSLSPGGTRDVLARLSATARLRVQLVGSVSVDALEAVRSQSFWVQPEDELAARAARVELHLEPPGRWAVVPAFERTVSEGGTPRTVRSNKLSFGEVAVSEALSPGRYTLVGCAPGDREARREVELLPGQTTDVTLSFE